MTSHLTGAAQYFDQVRSILDRVVQTQSGAIGEAADAVANTVSQGGAVYIFGTGHSHMLAEEGHFRAGGFAPVIPILVTNLMVHESAINSGRLERLSGLAGTILGHYQPTAQDIMFIFSNSGVNAVPVEMALEAKSLGMKVIGVSALAYARVAPRNALGKRLDEIADIVIDNQIQAGDALVEIGDTGLRGGPASTIAGAFILNAILTEGMCRLHASGIAPALYISSNMPGAPEHNQVLLMREKSRNPHL